MKFEKEFAQLLFRNAVIFIDSSIGYINKGLDNYVNMLQAIVNLQFAMELALKSSVVSCCGIRTILVSKQSCLSDSEIEELYVTNKLKIREYDEIKNFTKGRERLYNFERKEYQYMEMFQKYRNCVLHSSYIFNEQERQSVEKDVIYALIHILGILMSEETGIENRKFMQENYIKNTISVNLSKYATIQYDTFASLQGIAHKYGFEELRKPDYKAFEDYDKFLIAYNGGENSAFWTDIKTKRRQNGFE